MEYSFSIVIPVYNADKYIAEMIDSVVGQIYKRWNLIIIDDGSTDQSGIICDRYINENIEVFHCENQGQVAARVEGIMKATGDYTLVLDADDRINPDYLKRANEILNEKKYDAVMFPYQFCDGELNPTEKISSVPVINEEMNREEVIQWIIRSHSHGLVDKVIKTELIKKGAMETPKKRLKINGDYVLIIPIISQIKNAFFSNEVMYYYRVFDDSTSHNYTFQQILDTDYVSEMVKDYLTKNGLYSELLKEYVNVAYLKMIVMITEGIISKDCYNSKEYKTLRNTNFYKSAISYERIGNVGLRRFIELKIIRNLYFVLKPAFKVIQALQKIRGA